jgi:Ca2+-binding RTX toxin-like protein
LWLRLFGPNGPTTISELRDALKNLTFGPGPGDGHIAARLFELTGLTPAAIERPGPREVDRNLVVPASASPDGASQRPLDILSPGPGPIPAADPNDSRVFTIQAGNGNDEQATLLRRADLELIIPIGTNTQELEKAQKDNPNGSWTALFNQHDFARIAGAGENRVEFDAAGFAGLQAAAPPFDARFDTLSLAGDFSAGFTLSRIDAPLGQVSLQAGNDYALISDDDFVGGGTMMIIDGSKVGAGNHVMFDGSAETDGRISFVGSGGGDIVFGGAGNDWLRGNGGADVLTGGAGADTFVYDKASESTGANYDILADFNPSVDKIDLRGTVSGFGAAVQGGSLSDASFAHDLGAALGGLGAGKAVVYAPNAGDLAGTIFLIVDGNGVAGYQDGEDYVFALPGTTLADLAAHTDIFV